MINSKLISLLKTLSPQETHRFTQYLQSPYHNANLIYFQLFKAIKPYLHSRNRNEINSITIAKQIKPKEKYNALLFNKLCSGLYQLAADFLSLNEIETQTNTLQLNFLNVLNQRRLTDLFPFHQQQIQKKLGSPIKNNNHYLDAIIIQQHINNYQEIIQSRTETRNTNDVLMALDNFYLDQKIKYWSAALHYQKTFDQPISILWKDWLLPYIQHNSMPDFTIEVAKHILLLMNDIDAKKSYRFLKQNISTHQTKISTSSKREVYSFLINQCINKINSGELAYFKEIFDIYQSGLKENLVLQKKSISPWDFKNIVTVALQQNEIKWAENFITKYHTYLPSDERENAYHYNLAKVFFVQQKYNESLKLLNNIAYTDIFYQLDIKILQAKILYELNEKDTLEDLMISFEKLVKRKRKLSQHYQMRYKLFLTYLQKLLKTKTAVSANEISKKLLKADVPDKNWLLEKLNSI